MEVYILKKIDERYEKIGYLDQADSIVWINRYNDVGESEIYVQCDDDVISLLRRGNYIYREDDYEPYGTLHKIESVQIKTDVENGDYLIAVGKDVTNILSGRIVIDEYVYSGTVFGFIKKLIQDNVTGEQVGKRQIKNLSFYTENEEEFTETISTVTTQEDLLELIKTTCKTYNYGFKINYRYDTQSLVFSLYKGKNKASKTGDEYIEFSSAFSNIITSDYKEDDSDYKNICYVKYKNLAEEIELLPVYIGDEPSGEERKESYVDGSNVSREITEEELHLLFPEELDNSDGEWYYQDDAIVAGSIGEGKVSLSDFAYKKLIRELGLNVLAERVRTQEFVGNVDTVDTYQYKIDYDVGDIVKVINDYGIEAEARIIEVMESDDNDDGYVVEPKFEYIN